MIATLNVRCLFDVVPEDKLLVDLLRKVNWATLEGLNIPAEAVLNVMGLEIMLELMPEVEPPQQLGDSNKYSNSATWSLLLDLASSIFPVEQKDQLVEFYAKIKANQGFSSRVTDRCVEIDWGSCTPTLAQNILSEILEAATWLGEDWTIWDDIFHSPEIMGIYISEEEMERRLREYLRNSNQLPPI